MVAGGIAQAQTVDITFSSGTANTHDVFSASATAAWNGSSGYDLISVNSITYGAGGIASSWFLSHSSVTIDPNSGQNLWISMGFHNTVGLVTTDYYYQGLIYAPSASGTTGIGISDPYGINPTINTGVASYTCSGCSFAGAPEIDGSLAPKVGFLLGCLFLMFGRKRQNSEPMMTA